MDYQLQQTGPEVQGILNEAPGVIAASALDTLDATGMFYVADDNGKVSGIVLCTTEIEDGATVYVQCYLHDGVVVMRAGSSLPLTGEWVNLLQMQINDLQNSKVSKRTGYDLSKNDFTDYYKGTIETLMRDVSRLSDGKLGWEFVAELPAISYNTLGKVYFIQSSTDANCVDAHIVDTSVTPNAWKQIGKSIDTSVFYQKPANGIPKTDLASAVQTSLGKADTSVQPAALTPIQSAISVIEGLIPSAASSQNQLADKNYVDTHSSDIDVDDALSTTSENPVQNKVVTNALNGKQDTISTVNVTVDNNTGTPSGSASVSGSTLSLSFQNLKGATGIQGPQGIQGVPGPQGPKGDTGVTGDASSLAVIHGIDKTTTYGTTDVCGADAAQALLNEIEGGFYY